MAYNLTLTNGSALVTVPDGTTDSITTSITLVGKNFAGYGIFLNENFVKILENFSNTTAPVNPLKGQLWWNSSANLLQVNAGSPSSPVWKTVSSSTSSATPPSSPTVGDLWWDSANGQLKVWSGSVWTLVGPNYTSATGTSGPVAEIVTGTDSLQYIIVSYYVNNVRTAIMSRSATFTPSTPIAGFTTIKPGWNLADLSTGLRYWGTAEAAESLLIGGTPISTTNFLRKDIPDSTANTLAIANSGGLTVGISPSTVKLEIAGSAARIVSSAGQNLNLVADTNTALSVNGTSGLITVLADPIDPLGIATKQYVDNAIGGPAGSVLLRNGSNTITGTILPDANNTFNLGSSGTRFATIYATTFNGTATTAQYADLAERFEADDIYPPGTVVELGGDKEITAVSTELTENVFGVISTRAAYLMNAGAGEDETHPPVAMSGRVPVRVIGRVKKGDRLVSAGNGIARAASRNEITPFNVIGRSLENKTTDGEGLIEATVLLNA